MSDDVVLALDVGGTDLKGTVARRDGSTLGVLRRPTGAADGSAAVLGRVAVFLRDLAALATTSAVGRPVAAGVAVPGIVDESRGVACFAANLPWRDEPVAGALESELGVPVVLRHDVRSAGLAEARLGAARGVADFLLVSIGTGLAGAVFAGGAPVSGAHGRAGEIGHLCVEPAGARCGCGAVGCLETVASAAAIARRYAARRGGRADGAGSAIVPPAHSAKEVLQLAGRGDGVARAVRDEALGALAGVLATYQLVVDADLVLVAGGLSLAGPLLFEPLEAELARRCALGVVPRLAPAVFGADAGCVGAALAAWDELDRRDRRGAPPTGAIGGRGEGSRQAG
jgi:glucokinase